MLKKALLGLSVALGLGMVGVTAAPDKAEAGVRVYLGAPGIYVGGYRPRYHRGYRWRYRYGRYHCHWRWRYGYRVKKCHRHRIRYRVYY